MRTGSGAPIAVVGLGRMGRLHADNLATRVAGARLAGVADIDEPVARELGERHGVPWSTSIDELLAKPALAGIVIATPSARQPELVKGAAAAGKHVFCEKPLGLDIDSCAGAVAAARACRVLLQVGFQRRFDPGWQELKAALETGVIGELDLFRCSHRNAAPPPDPDGLGDLFRDMAVHDLDSARWLAGEPSEVYATEIAGGDAAIVSLRFENGAAGVIDLHRSAGYGFECSAELVGSQGTIRCGVHRGPDAAELLRAGSATVPLTRDHAERHAAAYVGELEHFAAVAAGFAEPVVTGHDALAALGLASTAALSAAAGVPLAVEEHAARAS
jgi:myo-inositol 2-dehydrogenase / D-chiro-inositol 1-dehydrogenase